MTFAEQWKGTGRLLRGQGDDAVEVPLDGEGHGNRMWEVAEVGVEQTELTQATADCRAALTMPDGKYLDERLWRAFELEVKPSGQIAHSTLIEADDPDDEHPDATADDRFAKLPFDLDLGELFCMLELGMLPPKPLEIGEPWTADTPPGGGLSANGRLISVDDGDAGPVAKLETRYACPVPERRTPAPDVVVVGTLTGRTTVFFELEAGRVKSASGPLELRLEFRRRGTAETLGKVELDLDLETTRTAP